jgi:hypothetical protein
VWTEETGLTYSWVLLKCRSVADIRRVRQEQLYDTFMEFYYLSYRLQFLYFGDFQKGISYSYEEQAVPLWSVRHGSVKVHRNRFHKHVSLWLRYFISFQLEHFTFPVFLFLSSFRACLFAFMHLFAY